MQVLLKDDKWSKRNPEQREIQVIQKDSDTSGPKEFSYRDPKTDLAQVVEKDPDTEILFQWSYRILTQAV